MQRKFIYALGMCAVTIMISRPCSAQEPNDSITVSQPLILRDTPPQEGLFYRKGEEIGALQKGETVVVVDTKIVQSILGDQVWILVKRLKVFPSIEADSGWTYIGKSSEQNEFISNKNKQNIKK